MNRFFAFIKKEFFHILRDYRTLLILIGMPVCQILLFGYAITNELNQVNIGIYDKTRDKTTHKLINKILSSGYFKLNGYFDTEKQIEDSFKSGKVKEVIVIDRNFSKNLIKYKKSNIQLLLDASDPNMANMVMTYTMGIINGFSKEMPNINKNNVKIIPEIRMQYNPELKSVYMFVPGLMAVILLLISAMMTSISISKEKELGTMEILLVSPLNPAQIIIGKVIPYILLSFINALIILTLATSIFNVPINGSLILLLGESILFIITALSLGIMISAITSSQQTALMVSLIGLMMPSMILSGYIFPIDNMPVWLQYITHLVPAKWFIRIVRNIMLKGVGYEYLIRENLILIGMTIIYILISIKKFKPRLE